MKRRGFLGTIAAGFGLATTTKANPFEKYYKAETINRNKEAEEVLKLYDHDLVSCSGTMEHFKPEQIVGSGIIDCTNCRCTDYAIR